jgi:UDP-glucose 4-epimerase
MSSSNVKPVQSLRILVTGGSGFIGVNLCTALVAYGHEVTSVSRSMNVPVSGSPSSPWRHIRASVTSAEEMKRCCAGIDVVVHLASSTYPASSNLDVVGDVRENMVGSVTLLDAAVRAGVRKVVFASSGGAIYGDPLSLPIDESHPLRPLSSYGIVKASTEEYLRMYSATSGVDYCSLRVANPYGPGQNWGRGQGVVAEFLYRALTGKPVKIWGGGRAIRDYIYIDDVVDAFVRAIHTDGLKRALNVGSGQGLSTLQVLEAVEAVTGLTVSRNFVEPEDGAASVSKVVLSPARAVLSLGWSRKVEFGEGLNRTLTWIRSRIHKLETS